MSETPTHDEMEAKLRSGYEIGYQAGVRDGYRKALNEAPYYCAFCDYHTGKDAALETIQEHILICRKHPLGQKIAELERAQEQLRKIQGDNP